jgi:hypothetical protein
MSHFPAPLSKLILQQHRRKNQGVVDGAVVSPLELTPGTEVLDRMGRMDFVYLFVCLFVCCFAVLLIS